MLITLKLLNRSMLKNVSFMILLLKMCCVFGQKQVVVIDTGHGGINPGAIGVNDIYEKDVVLKDISETEPILFCNQQGIYLT